MLPRLCLPAWEDNPGPVPGPRSQGRVLKSSQLPCSGRGAWDKRAGRPSPAGGKPALRRLRRCRESARHGERRESATRRASEELGSHPVTGQPAIWEPAPRPCASRDGQAADSSHFIPGMCNKNGLQPATLVSAQFHSINDGGRGLELKNWEARGSSL